MLIGKPYFDRDQLCTKYPNMFQKMTQVSIWKVFAYHFEYLGKLYSGKFSLQKYPGKEIWKDPLLLYRETWIDD